MISKNDIINYTLLVKKFYTQSRLVEMHVPDILISSVNKEIEIKSEILSDRLIEIIDLFLNGEKNLDYNFMDLRDPCAYCKRFSIGDLDVKLLNFNGKCEKGYNTLLDRSETGCVDFDPNDNYMEEIEFEKINRKKKWEEFDYVGFKNGFFEMLSKSIADRLNVKKN